MSVDYCAVVVYGIPFEQLFVPTDGDGYDVYGFWEEAAENYVQACNEYDFDHSGGIIGDVVLKTESYSQIDFANIDVDTSDKHVAEIREAYGILTGSPTEETPKMYVMLRIW